MSMTVVVTRNASARVRGFLASCMLEVGPGAYCAPRINPAVRGRIWEVLSEWVGTGTDASVVMVWADPSLPGGQRVQTLGLPSIDLVEIDGLVVARKDASEATPRAL